MDRAMLVVLAVLAVLAVWALHESSRMHTEGLTAKEAAKADAKKKAADAAKAKKAAADAAIAKKAAADAATAKKAAADAATAKKAAADAAKAKKAAADAAKAKKAVTNTYKVVILPKTKIAPAGVTSSSARPPSFRKPDVTSSSARPSAYRGPMRHNLGAIDRPPAQQAPASAPVPIQTIQRRRLVGKIVKMGGDTYFGSKNNNQRENTGEERVQVVQPVTPPASNMDLYVKWAGELSAAATRIKTTKEATIETYKASYGSSLPNSYGGTTPATREDALAVYKAAASSIASLDTDLPLVRGAYNNAVNNLDLVSTAEISDKDRAQKLRDLKASADGAKDSAELAKRYVGYMKAWADDVAYWGANNTASSKWEAAVAQKDIVLNKTDIVSTNYGSLTVAYDSALKNVNFAKQKAIVSASLLETINSAAADALSAQTAFETALKSVPTWHPLRKTDDWKNFATAVADAVKPLTTGREAKSTQANAAFYNKRLQELAPALANYNTAAAAASTAAASTAAVTNTASPIKKYSSNAASISSLAASAVTNYTAIRQTQRFLTEAQRNSFETTATQAQTLLNNNNILLSQIENLKSKYDTAYDLIPKWVWGDDTLNLKTIVFPIYVSTDQSGDVELMQLLHVNYEEAENGRKQGLRSLRVLNDKFYDIDYNLEYLYRNNDPTTPWYEGTLAEFTRLIGSIKKRLVQQKSLLGEITKEKTKYLQSVDVLSKEPISSPYSKQNFEKMRQILIPSGFSGKSQLSIEAMTGSIFGSKQSKPARFVNGRPVVEYDDDAPLMGGWEGKDGSLENMMKKSTNTALWATIGKNVTAREAERKRLIAARDAANDKSIEAGGATAAKAFGVGDKAYALVGTKVPSDDDPFYYDIVDVTPLKFPVKSATFTYGSSRRPRVFLGVCNLDSDEFDIVVSPESKGGWSFVSQNIDAIWMNYSQISKMKNNQETNRFVATTEPLDRTWPNRILNATKARNVVMVQNMVQDKETGEAKPFANAAVNIAKTVYNENPMFKGIHTSLNVVGSSIVTDYVCDDTGDDDCENEPWDLQYIQDVKDYHMNLSVFDFPNMSVPLWPSTRVNWWGETGPKTKQYLDIVNASDGVVLESAPINFLAGHPDNPNRSPGAKAKMCLFAMKNCVQWCRANGKPVVWLAPKGKTSAYLDTMKQTWALFADNACQPDAVVVINYAPGANKTFAFGPERNGTASTNTLTGVARWLMSGQ